jgi:hypothetical protein
MVFNNILNDKKAFHQFYELQKKCDNSNVHKKCLFNNCGQPTLENSHIVQRAKFLDTIARKGKVVESRLNPYLIRQGKSPIVFKKDVGITKAMSLPLFCQHHDDKVFSYIEKCSKVKEDYLSALLICYRALCAEIRKKLKNNYFYLRLYSENTLACYLSNSDFDYIEKCLWIDEISINELGYLKHLLEGEIIHVMLKEPIDTSMTFSFKMFKKIPVCISAITGHFRNDNHLSKDFPGLLFINILPLHSETLAIVGYHNKFKVDETVKQFNIWNSMKKDDFPKRVSHMITKKVETWAMAPDFFENLNPDKLKTLQTEWTNNLTEFQNIERQYLTADFNLFE